MNLLKIMLVDDDDMSNFLSTKIIEKSGIASTIIAFDKPFDALEYLIHLEEKKLPDIIFLDINMPLLDGWDFLSELMKHEKKFTGKVKIFLLSSSIYLKDQERAKSFPIVTDFINKPLNLDKLKVFA